MRVGGTDAFLARAGAGSSSLSLGCVVPFGTAFDAALARLGAGGGSLSGDAGRFAALLFVGFGAGFSTALPVVADFLAGLVAGFSAGFDAGLVDAARDDRLGGSMLNNVV